MHNTKCSKKKLCVHTEIINFLQGQVSSKFLYLEKKYQEIQLKMLFRENCSEIAVENFKKTPSSTPV